MIVGSSGGCNKMPLGAYVETFMLIDLNNPLSAY